MAGRAGAVGVVVGGTGAAVVALAVVVGRRIHRGGLRIGCAGAGGAAPRGKWPDAGGGWRQRWRRRASVAQGQRPQRGHGGRGRGRHGGRHVGGGGREREVGGAGPRGRRAGDNVARLLGLGVVYPAAGIGVLEALRAHAGAVFLIVVPAAEVCVSCIPAFESSKLGEGREKHTLLSSRGTGRPLRQIASRTSCYIAENPVSGPFYLDETKGFGRVRSIF